MSHFLKIASNINISSLALELHQHPELWGRDTERLQPGSPHADSSDIWIRHNDKTSCLALGDFSSFNDEHDPVWYPAFYSLPSLRPLIFDLARLAEAERIGGVFLWRLRPGQAILPHIDFGWHSSYYSKFNICIASAPGCAFVYDAEAMQERPGDVHTFNNDILHSVVNHSESDYIVLCVCLRTHDFNRVYKEKIL